MRPLVPSSTSSARYNEIGGVLQFSLFGDADEDAKSFHAAIEQTIPAGCSFDRRHFDLLSPRILNREQFLGSWHDSKRGLLLRPGTHRVADGRILEDPALVDLQGLEVMAASYNTPEAGSGGEFAYAFSFPPHNLRAQPHDIQALFNKILALILPLHDLHEILDWSSPDLPKLSDYFEDGMEWWGVFLFTLYSRTTRRLVVIAGSTTD